MHVKRFSQLAIELSSLRPNAGDLPLPGNKKKNIYIKNSARKKFTKSRHYILSLTPLAITDQMLGDSISWHISRFDKMMQHKGP